MLKRLVVLLVAVGAYIGALNLTAAVAAVVPALSIPTLAVSAFGAVYGYARFS